MQSDVLTELKRLQHSRSESSPFSSHIEFETWADRVTPLLAFDPNLQSRFTSMVLATKHARILKSTKQEIENINSAIGMVNQAIKSLEVVPVSPPKENPKSMPANTSNPPSPSLTIQVGIGILIGVVVLLVGYLLKEHLGIS